MKPLGARARAERFHRDLLERTLRCAGALENADLRLVTTGNLDAARTLARQSVPRAHLEVLAQTDGSLGARLSCVVEHAFADGYRRVVVVGADTPTLTTSDFTHAFARLADPTASAVLGPAPDGGFYLIGLNRPTRAPFDDRFLRTDRANAAAQRALEESGFGILQLTPRADVDSIVDLRRLRARLATAVASDDVRLRRVISNLLATTSAPSLQIIAPRSATPSRSAAPRGPPQL